MNPKTWKMLVARGYFMAPAGDGNDGGGGEEKVDRGDDWTPTPDEPESPDMKQAKADKAAASTKDLPKDKAAALKEIGGGSSDVEGDEDPEKEKPEGKDEKSRKRIPLERHEAILKRERERREAAENALKGYQGQQQVVQANEQLSAKETEVAKLQAEYDKALVDGNTAQASKLMADIRKLDREISALESESKIAQAEARAIETTRYNIALERIEAAYPVLNEDHDDFDQDVYAEVLDLVKAYRASGKTPTESLQRAVKVLLGSSTNAQKDSTSVKPRVDGADVDKKKVERAAAAQEKAVAATEKSPGTATAKAGLNSDAAGAARTAKDVIKMSQADFAKLDDKELARLRGDEVDA